MPTMPTEAIENLVRRKVTLEELLDLQNVELHRHGMTLDGGLEDARAEMVLAVDELVEELAELAEELEE